MEYEKIKQLIDDMGNSKLTEIDINFPDGTKISMKKSQEIHQAVIASKIERQAENGNGEYTANKYVIQNESQESKKDNEKAENNQKEETGNIVKSPMVGTFYIKPSPTAEPYVEIGKQVKKGNVLCIIEAMKLMNEIESEYDGEIAEICVKNEEMVEFGKILFKIK